MKCIEVEGDFFWAGTAGGLYKWHKNGTLIAFYDVHNGLINNNVTCIKKDYITDALWVGTSDGLSRLDGTIWTSYTTTSGLVTNNLTSIVVDLTGNVWVGGWGGVSCFNGSNWISYSETDGLIGYGVKAIAVDFQNNKWIGTTTGLSKFNGITWTNYTTSEGLSTNDISALAVDAQNNIWIGVWLVGVCKFDGTTFTDYTMADGLPTNGVNSMAFDALGNKWFATSSGVAKFDGTTWITYTAIDGLVNTWAQTIVIDSQNNKWFGTYNGISKFDGSNWISYLSPPGLVDNNVSDVLIDNNGNKWFSTWGGLSKFNGTSWTNYNANNSGLNSQFVTSIAVDDSNNIWCGTGGGVFKFNGTTWSAYYSSVGGLLPGVIRDVYIDSIGNKWFATTNGVSKFNGTIWTNYTSVDGLVNDYVNGITSDNNGNMWFACMGGVSKFDGLTWTSYTETDGLCFYLTNKITVDSHNNKWIATYGGISKYNDTTWTTYNIFNGLADNTIFSIAIDMYDNCWIASSGGLTKFDGQTFINYTTTNGLVNNNIYSIKIDSNNNKWIGTSGGVSKVHCEAPIVNFIADTACLSQATTFINASDKTDAFTKYEWDINNDGNTDYTNENITHIFSLIGIHTVKLTASNESCSSVITKYVKVNSYPQVSITSPGSTSVCQGNFVNLNANITNLQAGNAYSYAWSNGSIENNINTNISGNYSVTVTNENCSASASNSIDVFIQHPFENEEICLVTVDTITWKNKIMWEKTSGVGTIGYNVFKEIATNYYSNIGFVPYSNPAFLIDYASQPESYGNRYKISVMDSCLNESQKSFYHNTMNLTISAFGSTMGLSWTPYFDQSGTFIPSMYYIYRGNNPMSLSLYDSIPGTQTSYNDNNVFNVYYYIVGVKKDIPCDVNGSRNSFSNTKDNSTLLWISTQTYGTIKVSPNPFTESTTITIPNFQFSTFDFQLSIIDITGKTVRIIDLSKDKNYQQSTFNLKLNRGDLKSGVYFVELRGDRVYRGKLIVN